MMKLKPDTKYRAIELVFESNIEAVLARMAEDVKKTFSEEGFKYATLIVDLHNPSTKPMFP